MFTTPGMAAVNLGASQWQSGKNLSQYFDDLSEYSQEKAEYESTGGAAGTAVGAFLDYFLAPQIGLPPGTFTFIGNLGGSMIGEHQAGDAPLREDYDIMFGQDRIDEAEFAFEEDEAHYDNVSQILDSIGVTSQILMSMYGPKFLGEIFGGTGSTGGALPRREPVLPR